MAIAGFDGAGRSGFALSEVDRPFGHLPLCSAAKGFPVQEQLSRITVGVHENRHVLTHMVGPVPMRQNMDGCHVRPPVAAVQIEPVLRYAAQIHDAEVGASRLLRKRSRLAYIVKTRPDQFAGDKIVVLHQFEFHIRNV